MSIKIEQEAEDTIGNPPFVGVAIRAILQRIAQANLLVDNSSDQFSKNGPGTNWKEMSAGVNSNAAWTYNEQADSENQGRWQLRIQKSGRYLVDAYIHDPENNKRTSYEINRE